MSPRRYRRLSRRFLVGRVSDGGVVLDLKSGRYSKVDSLGLTILHLVTSGTPFDDVVAEISATFDMDEGLVGRDVRSFLAGLIG